MSNQNFDKSRYDVVSLNRKGSEKKANYVQDAYHMSKTQKSSGQFVRVFADIFLKHETKKSYC
jgi:hypothetical protein